MLSSAPPARLGNGARAATASPQMTRPPSLVLAPGARACRVSLAATSARRECRRRSGHAAAAAAAASSSSAAASSPAAKAVAASATSVACPPAPVAALPDQDNNNNNDISDNNVIDPDELQLEPGVPSKIDRTSALRPEDAAFRCPGCTRPECAGPSGCEPSAWRLRPDGYLRKALTARVYDVAVQSPLEPAQRLGESLGATVLLKREDLQPVFSFKVRGAYNRMSRMTPEQLARGVITASAGNHAQGVALAAQKLGARAVICMPVSTPEIKLKNVRRLGGEVALVGESYTEAQTAALLRAEAEGLTFIPAFDDPYTIAGTATVGDEILRQTDAEALDAIFVPIGGGGLAAGIAAYVKALNPDIKVFGVEPAGANTMALSLLRGRRFLLGRADAFADGVAVKQVGVEPFRLCREFLDGVLLVDNAAISAAIKDVFNDTRSIVEPAGAVAVAGAKAWLQREFPVAEGEDGGATTTKKRPTVVAITSGANMNFDRLRLVSDLAALGSRAEAMFATTISERPGSFRAFVAAATGVPMPSSSAVDAAAAAAATGQPQQQQPPPTSSEGISVTEFKYRCVPGGGDTSVLWSATVGSAGAAAEIARRLCAAGLPTQDIGVMGVAQVHLRHLVGGRATGLEASSSAAAAAAQNGSGGGEGGEGGGGGWPHERIFAITCPERPGALAAFIGALSPEWNVTLFHYRETGNRESSVLVGVQLPPPDSGDAFFAAVGSLGDDFRVEEVVGREAQVFGMFLR